MTIQEYKKIDIIVRKLRQDITKSALKSKIDITSNEFDGMLEKAVKNLLKEQGFSYQEYLSKKIDDNAINSGLEEGQVIKNSEMVQFLKEVGVAISDIKATKEQIKKEVNQFIKDVKVERVKWDNVINRPKVHTEEEIKWLIKGGIDGIPKGETSDQIATKASKMALDEVLLSIPTIDQIGMKIPQLGLSIRDGLELLEGEERLSITAISGLDDYEEVRKLAKEPRGGGGSVARNFYQLFDVPQSYSGQSGKVLSVKTTEDGLEFTAGGTGTDEKVKYNAADTSAGYLGAKTVAGTGITLSEGTGGDADKLKITNSAPDQVVAITGTGIATATGTYPNFNIDVPNPFLIDPVDDWWDPTGGLPVDPDVGDRYGSDGTAGGWTDGYIYEWDGDEWVETSPVEGMMFWMIADLIFWVFFSGGWMEVGESTFLKLDQTVPQAFTAGTVAGSGLLKVTTGVLGLDTSTYLTDAPSDGNTYGRKNGAWSIIPGGGDMVLADVQSVTGLKTFDKDKIAMKGTSTGTNIISVANTSATSYTNTLPAKDGTFAMTSDIPDVSGYVKTDQTSGQTIGDTTNRLTKLWATDITCTNAIAGSVTGNAGTVTNATLTTALTVNTGAVTLTGNVAGSVLTIGAGAVSVSGSNTGDQDLSGYVPTSRTVNTLALTGNIVVKPSNIPAETVIGTPTYGTLNDIVNSFGSAGRKTGGVATNAGSSKVAVTAGTGFIKATDDDNAQLIPFDWAAPADITIPADSSRYIGVEYNAGSPQIVTKTSSTWDYDTDFPLARAVNETINGAESLYVVNTPWWVTDGMTNIIQAIRSFGLVRRDEYVGGLILSGTGTRNIAVSAGNVWAALNDTPFAGIDTAVTGTVDGYWYKAGSGWQKSALTQWSKTEWNDITQTTLQTLSANKYANVWIYGEMTDSTISISLLYPQAQYNTAAEAESKPAPDNVPTHIAQLGMLLGRFIIKQNVDAPVATESVFTTGFSTSVVTSHANLASLGWTSSGHTGTASTIAGFSATGASAEYTLSGTGTALPTTTAPTFVTSITTPSVLATANDSGALGASGTAFSDLFLASGGVINWNAGASTITHSANTLTIGGSGATTLALGTNSLTMTGSIGATGSRVTKLWATDIESTNMPTVGGTAILTSLTAPQFTTIELGHATENTLSASGGVLSIEGVPLLKNIVEDTTPELGGEMDCGAHSIGFTQQTATGDGTTTIDWKLGNKFYFTFGNANETFTFTAPSNPCNLVLVLKQYSTGGKTATWPNTVMWPGGTAPTLSTGNNDIDIVSMYWDGTNYFAVASLDFSVPA